MTHPTSLLSILPELQKHREKQTLFSLTVPNPDLLGTDFSGSLHEVDGEEKHVHSYQTWVDLAELFSCRLLTPEQLSTHEVRLRFLPLNEEENWHAHTLEEHSEKYGKDSPFFQLNKAEEPYFVSDLLEGVEGFSLRSGERVLVLGAHKGDEVRLLQHHLEETLFSSLDILAVDHSRTAVDAGIETFQQHPNVRWLCEDINRLPDMELGKFSLVISVGTLQSPGVKDRELMRWLTKEALEERSAFVLGFPNSRYIQGALRYGAEMKNYSTSEASLLIKELSFYKRFLQQHRYRVRIKGKYYQFVMAYRALKQT